jgi:hypothetical protein
MQYRYRKNNYISRFNNYVDISNFKDKSKENIECVVFLLFDVIRSAVFDVHKNARTVEEARNILNRKVAIIKSGATLQ